MYLSQQLVRAEHEERLRQAERRRLMKQAAAAAPVSGSRSPRRLRIIRPEFRPSRPVGHR